MGSVNFPLMLKCSLPFFLLGHLTGKITEGRESMWPNLIATYDDGPHSVHGNATVGLCHDQKDPF